MKYGLALNGKDIRRYLCGDCGYRFSDSSVKVNVVGKVGESLDSGENHHEVRVASRDASDKKVDNSLPFTPGEDVASHTISIIEKDLSIYLSIKENTIFESSSDEFSARVPNKPEEVKSSLEVGSEYVCQKDRLIFLRKRK